MSDPAALPSFYDQLLGALQLVQQPSELGAQSSLASPYFLGPYLAAQPAEIQGQASGRGKALIALLTDAINDLAEQHPNGEEYRQLLQRGFFERRTKRDGDVWDALGMARATYFRVRKVAVQALEPAIIHRANPALRPEKPQAPAFFVGRATEVESCRAAILARRTIGLAGPGGIGKTTFAARLISEFPAQPVFWYTLHLGINDNLSGLVFALAHFLHTHGASALWLQLLADRGQVDLEILPALLRRDMALLADHNPIFCLDDIDLLRPEIEAHAQIFSFLEGLPCGVATLLVGQTIPLLTDTFIALDAMPAAMLRQILQHHHIVLSPAPLAQLVEYTKGNPRLLGLYIALHQSGEAIEEVLARAKTAPSLEALLNRVWVRLRDEERSILLQLAVFRRPVPADVWQSAADQATLMRLVERQLVQSDGAGAVMVLAALRTTLYATMTAETLEPLHQAAAAIRALHSEFTAAAYHLAQAGVPEAAIRLWYPNRATEIEQGQAGTALQLFENISQNQLAEQEDRETLRLIRGELHKLLGNYDRAQASLSAIEWRTPRLAARARRLMGDVAELRGELDAAAIVYQEGLTTIEAQTETELALFHRDLSWVYRRQKRFDLAWGEAQAAQYEIENLKGHIYRDRGDYEEAEGQYRRALALAVELRNADGEAKTRNALASLLIRQGRFAEAETHFDLAYQAFRRIGKIMSVASVRVNQSVACLLDERPQDAIPYADQARTIFAQLQHPYGLAIAYQALAEAHLATGDIDRAEQFGRQAVETEESTVIPDALRVVGEVQLARGAVHAAEQTIQQAVEAARENKDRYLEAYAQRALGKVLLQTDADRAMTALNAAIALFTEIGLPDEVERTRQLMP